jgi:hypothetical protein
MNDIPEKFERIIFLRANNIDKINIKVYEKIIDNNNIDKLDNILPFPLRSLLKSNIDEMKRIIRIKKYTTFEENKFKLIKKIFFKE